MRTSSHAAAAPRLRSKVRSAPDRPLPRLAARPWQTVPKQEPGQPGSGHRRSATGLAAMAPLAVLSNMAPPSSRSRSSAPWDQRFGRDIAPGDVGVSAKANRRSALDSSRSICLGLLLISLTRSRTIATFSPHVVGDRWGPYLESDFSFAVAPTMARMPADDGEAMPTAREAQPVPDRLDQRGHQPQRTRMLSAVSEITTAATMRGHPDQGRHGGCCSSSARRKVDSPCEKSDVARVSARTGAEAEDFPGRPLRCMSPVVFMLAPSRFCPLRRIGTSPRGWCQVLAPGVFLGGAPRASRCGVLGGLVVADGEGDRPRRGLGFARPRRTFASQGCRPCRSCRCRRP